jgi:hypothetical protein
LIVDPEKFFRDFSFNLSSLLLGIVICSFSEGGRILGHLRHHRLSQNLFLRFNWYLEMGNIAENERRLATITWAWRIVVVAIFLMV